MSLTLFDEEICECEHDRVATVQVVAAHGVGTGDGEASAGDHLHDPPHLSLPVP